MENSKLPEFENPPVTENLPMFVYQRMIKVIQLKKEFCFRDEQQVTNYLMQHPNIIAVLKEVKVKINEYFKEYKNIFLKVFTDPEGSKDSEEELVVIIQVNSSVEETIKYLNAFEDNWLLEQPYEKIKNLIITTEYL